ncbi:MAG TPA: hypothetical protein V6D47_17080, partial [Oscillatoriaceae cyanobacterium]
DKTTALIQAFHSLFPGQAQAAVVFPELHQAGVEMENMQKEIGRGANSAFGAPILAFVEGLKNGLDAIKEFVSWLRDLMPAGVDVGEILTQMAQSLGTLASIVLSLLAPLALFKGAVATLSMLGVPFAGAVAAAGAAAFALGTFISQIEVSGVKIKDWVAIGIVWIQGRLGDIWDGLRRTWVELKAAGDVLWDGLKLATAEGVKLIIQHLLLLGEAWNAVPFHKEINLDNLKNALAGVKNLIDAEVQAIRTAGADARKEIAKIDAEQAKRQAENLSLMTYIYDTSKVSPKKSAPTRSAEPRNNPNPTIPGSEEQAKLQRNFELETQLLQAKNAGNQAEVDRLAILIEQNKLEQELAQVDATKRTPLIKARLDAEKSALALQRQRTQDELTLSQKLGALEIQRANIEAGLYTTTEQKQRAIVPLLEQENKLIAERIALLEHQLAAGVTEKDQQTIQQQLDQLRQKQAQNTRAKEEAQPQTFIQGAEQGLSGKGGFLESIGSAANVAAQSVTDTLNSALQGTAGLIENLWTRTKSWGDAWRGMIVGVGQQFSQMASQMVAKLLWKFGIEKSLTALAVMFHITGEKTKTAATLTGSVTRLGATVKEALASVYHGAVEAFEALASIPYVGPFLAGAAMAAALAGGIALVSKIGHADGGIISGPGGPRDDRIPAMLSNGEAVTRASVVSRFGERFFNRLNSGVLDLAALPGNVTRGMASPVYAGAGGSSVAGGTGGTLQSMLRDFAGRITPVIVQSEQQATRIHRQAAASDVIWIINNNRDKIFKRGPG